MFTKNAYDVWQEEKEAGFILTLCKDFDDAIGGGIHIGSITELVGAPGTGKTQFCLQLCVNVQIPKKNLHGLQGSAIYIDTNRGFSINRIREIATASKTHYDFVCQKEKMSNEPKLFTVDKILNNIHCTFCNNYIEFTAIIHGLSNFLEKNTNASIKLIVIDSFSYLLRSIDMEDMNIVQTSYELLSKLQTVAEEYKCAVLITNELTTHVRIDGNTEIVPALGESHSHRINHQISLARNDDDKRLFIAKIDKCFVKGERIIPLQVTKDGLRPYKKVHQAD